MDAFLTLFPEERRQICLVAAEREPDWRRDYEAMKESMFFGAPPQWSEILRVVGEFEARFNAAEPA